MKTPRNYPASTKLIPIKTLFHAALLCPTLLLLLAAAPPLGASGLIGAPASAAQEDAAYAAGTRAMNQQQWSDAVANFDKVINARSSRADAALYWKAYSLNKLGNGPLALAACARLRAQYESSSWNKDCSALTIDLHGAISDAMKNMTLNLDAMKNMNIDVNPSIHLDMDRSHPHDPNEDIKILALNSLLRQDPARALPILRGILTGNDPINMKRHALFVLAQNKSPEAQSILHDAVTGKMDPALQRQAIESMAIFQGKRDNDTLAEVYRTTTDHGVKRAVISAFFITHDAPHMVEIARGEKDLETKRDIVSKLALMHDKAATDYMLELLK